MKLNITILTIFIILILVFCIAIIIYIYIKSNSIIDTSIAKVNRIYDLLQQVTCELDRNNIPYIITAGTLLGSVRHSGMISWDDDGDLAIVMDNNITSDEIIILKQKVINCLQVLNKNNIITYEHTIGNILNSQFSDSEMCLDTFFLLSDSDGIYRYLEPFDTKYKNEYFTHSEIFPIKEYTFGPITLKGPNNNVNFLNRAYNNWQSVASKWNHNNQTPLDFNQTIFNPALPETSNQEFPWIKKECLL